MRLKYGKCKFKNFAICRNYRRDGINLTIWIEENMSREIKDNESIE